MSTNRKKRTADEKLLILQEGEHNGIAATCRLHGISASLYYKWRDKYEIEGLEGLRAYSRRENPEFRQLQDENRRLKQLLADKELQIQMQNDLLRKKVVPRHTKGK